MSKKVTGMKYKDEWHYPDGDYEINIKNIKNMSLFISKIRCFSMKCVSGGNSRAITCNLCGDTLNTYNPNRIRTKTERLHCKQLLFRHLEFNHEMTVTDLEEVQYGAKII